MKKSELIAFVSQDTQVSQQDAKCIVERMFEAMQTTLKEEGRFAYPGFGSLLLRHRGARKGRDPRTGKTIEIAASNTVGFRAASKLKDALN